MNVVVFFVDGYPVPKQRARSGRNGRHYTPERTRAWEQRVRLRARAASRGRWSEYAGPVKLEIEVGSTRGDLDNHAKSVSDACNDVLWVDDRQIDELHVKRLRDGTEGVHVRVTQLENGECK